VATFDFTTVTCWEGKGLLSPSLNSVKMLPLFSVVVLETVP